MSWFETISSIQKFIDNMNVSRLKRAFPLYYESFNSGFVISGDENNISVAEKIYISFHNFF